MDDIIYNVKSFFALFLTFGTPIGIGTFLKDLVPLLQIGSLVIGMLVGVTIIIYNLKKIKKIK